MKKYALVTGSTGDIGGEFAQLLDAAGYPLCLPVRNVEKAQLRFPTAQAALCDLADFATVLDYIKGLHANTIQLDVVVLAAGGRGPNKEFFDSEFSGDTPEEMERNAIKTMREINVLTKETFLTALKDVYGAALRETTLILMGSHAAGFEIGDPKRNNEEGYVRAMIEIHLLGEKIKSLGLFKDVIVAEPGLVEGELTSDKFAALIADPSVPRVSKRNLAQTVLSGAGLI